MFKKKPLLIICCFYIIIGCKNESSLTFTDSNFTSKNNTRVQVNIPFASENNKVAEPINNTIKNKVIYALQIGEPKNSNLESIEKCIENFNQEYNAFITDFPDSAQKWEAEIDGEIMLQSPEIISIAITSYVDTGGAHGNLNLSFLNFDTATGTLISNTNLFKDTEGFKQIAKTSFEEEIKTKEGVFNSDTFKLPENIGFNEEGIILLYNTYEIAPYSTGIIEFTIPYNEINSFLVFNGS